MGAILLRLTIISKMDPNQASMHARSVTRLPSEHRLNGARDHEYTPVMESLVRMRSP